MILTAMLDQPNVKRDDPVIDKGVKWVLTQRKPDGGIYVRGLENYNTAICLSMLARINNEPGMAESIKKTQDYLRNLQWAGQKDSNGNIVDENHRWYGGAGYGGGGRPDANNLIHMVQGLHDSGLDCNDPAFQRAVAFMTKLQGSEANKQFGNQINPNGGAIYATSINGKDKANELESKAGTVKLSDGSERLQTYGSMTFAMFTTYLYAEVHKKNPNDLRITDALRWISQNYTTDHNPGLPEKDKLMGHFNYLITMSRALRAWGQDTITLADGSKRAWRHDVINQIVAMQKPDGSWTNPADRWMESDPNLVTAYALLALQSAIR